MRSWKKIMVFGAIGVGAALIVTGRRPAGVALAVGGLAVLASEYPEKFEGLLEDAPDYLRKGVEILTTLKTVGERLVAEAENRGIEAAG